jgi:hypothetical protein
MRLQALSILWFHILQACFAALARLDLAINELRPLLSSNAIVTLPNDTRWGELEIRASSPRVSPSYNVIVEVATEADVQAVVKTANRHAVPFLAISGAHGWTRTLNKLAGGIQINMRKLNITVLSSDGTAARVGGGTLQYEITRALFEKGKYAGVSKCPVLDLPNQLLIRLKQSPDSQNAFQLLDHSWEVDTVCFRTSTDFHSTVLSLRVWCLRLGKLSKHQGSATLTCSGPCKAQDIISVS